MSQPTPRRAQDFATTTLLSASVATASSLVLLQLLSRLVTFALNQALVRLASPEVFGTASIQFELLLSTILFLSREGVRNALLRANDPGKGKEDALVQNIALLPVYLGVPISILTSLAYLRLSAPSTRAQPHFDTSVWLYALGAFFALLSEPLHIRAVNELRFGIRVRAEGAAVVLNSVVTFVVIWVGGAQWCLVGFAVGKVGYGLTILLVYLWEYRILPLVPHKVSEQIHGNVRTRYFDEHLLRLSLAMSAQSVVKHFLTEGDRLIVSRISHLEDQGGYAVASNYGSLVARIVFLPMEETSRLFFSKTLSSASPSAPSSPTSSSLLASSDILHTLLLFDSHLALTFLALGPPLIPSLLSFLLPARYLSTSAPRVLSAYCLYLPIMAYNGILESFFASTSTPSALRAQSYALLLFSAIFVAACWAFTAHLHWAETGLVYANALNLLLRALYAWAYVRRYFRARGVPQLADWRKAVPKPLVLAVFAVAAGVVRASEQRLEGGSVWGRVGQLGVGAACGVVCLAVATGTEREALRQLVGVIRRR